MSKRQSNFELLRIVSMAMIVACHYCYYGGALFEGSGMIWFIAAFLKTGGKLGVTCFVLISGYFMCDKEFKISSVLKVSLQTIFYSVLAVIIALLFGNNIGIRTAFTELLSPVYGCYWFVTAYIGMCFLSPFLNVILQKLCNPANRGGYALIYLGILQSIMPSLFIDSNFMFDNIRWFCFLYLIGGYIRRNPVRERISTTKASICFTIMMLFIWAFTLGANSILEGFIGISSDKIYWLSNTFSPFILLAGISLFVLFERIEISSKIINYVAGSTFAVYLLHDNSLLREILWKQICHTELFLENPLLLIVHLILCMACIFLFAIIIEIGRRRMERKLFSWNCIKNIDSRAEKIFKWL